MGTNAEPDCGSKPVAAAQRSAGRRQDREDIEGAASCRHRIGSLCEKERKHEDTPICADL